MKGNSETVSHQPDWKAEPRGGGRPGGGCVAPTLGDAEAVREEAVLRGSRGSRGSHPGHPAHSSYEEGRTATPVQGRMPRCPTERHRDNQRVQCGNHTRTRGGTDRRQGTADRRTGGQTDAP